MATKIETVSTLVCDRCGTSKNRTQGGLSVYFPDHVVITLQRLDMAAQTVYLCLDCAKIIEAVLRPVKP